VGCNTKGNAQSRERVSNTYRNMRSDLKDTWQMNDEATRDNVQFLDSQQFQVAKIVGFGKEGKDWTSPGKSCAL
jgi:hypothetical protein